MKKLSLIMAVLMIMLSTMGFTSVEKAYWEENKKIISVPGEKEFVLPHFF